ncbi:CidA/LrgA family protein [Clostridium septicum]|uniref:CidA/LrgA family protein n=1 Tax=Clostridium septicum TaxID=1504 RepID=A0A9N7JMJ8_CLOSE|nr:CidA/LrgA family protein [Clostridium septicum]AYE35414.1 CidA/LrgA family protein [Clostridium septicum]MDU1314387.1 CidA/LrgA family protein [Clostridium septicum]QAS60802.1 CidA/LrgA family protein [Clostridium septicum]UEC19934.1 CidA/LrgA family protein [Clostridium septicum]USS02006.1 CidA/LrgA family protein [Clostridium septicum]
MKLFRQSIIILGIYLLGELISKGLNLPVPGNIIGMLLLLLLLCTKVIKVENVETVSNFFLDHLAFFFIPAGVGLLTSFDSIKSSLIQIVLVCIIATTIVIVVTGLVVQFVSNKLNIKKNGSEKN